MQTSDSKMRETCSHTTCSLSYCGDERWLTCNDCKRNLYFRSKDLIIDKEETYERIRALERQVEMLCGKLNEIYYAPGMPGYLAVKNDFETKSMSPDL